MFDGFLHVGSDKGSHGLEESDYIIRADTFFSALCNEIVRLYDDNYLKEFINMVEDDKFLISDLMPFYKEHLYVPKPVLNVESDVSKLNVESSNDRKKNKDLKYISVEHLSEYLDSLKTENTFITDDYKYEKELIWKNSIDDEHNSEPYVLSSVRFEEDYGLYFITKFGQEFEEKFEIILDSLSFTGIGGKKSIGYGKFDLYEDPIEIYFDEKTYLYESDLCIKKMLSNKTSSNNLLISTLIPNDKDIDILKDSTYTLIKRSGFVYSMTYLEKPVKKNSIISIEAGSILKEKLKGRIADLSNHGSHPIYRYGKGFYLGVDINE